MNRREALAALVSLPEISRISTAPVKPDDVIVVESDHALTRDTIDRLTAIMESVWPGRKCIVLSEGLKLKVVGS